MTMAFLLLSLFGVLFKKVLGGLEWKHLEASLAGFLWTDIFLQLMSFPGERPGLWLICAQCISEGGLTG